jgi:DNA-binding NtrC family response regulator
VAEDLISSRIRDALRAPSAAAAALQSAAGVAAAANLHEAVEQLERKMIWDGLVRTRFNKSQLARELGISRSNLILKIEKFGLERPELASGDEA